MPESGEEVRLVSEGFMHPDYMYTSKEFDIGLVKLLTPLNFTEKIRPVPLNEGPVQTGTVCTATGWGITRENGLLLASHLQKEIKADL